MPNFAEKLIERLINDGIITESELEQRIQEAKENSPLVSLPTMQDDVSYLVFDAMAKDFEIAELKQTNADLTFIIMTGGM